MAKQKLTTNSEIWKPVPDWPNYEISNLGHVRKIVKSFFDQHGYPRVSLSAKGKRKNRPIHILVANAFIGPRPGGHQVNHRDGQKDNPRLENLEYLTPSQNMYHAADNGLRPLGTAVHTSKLQPEEIPVIRELVAAGTSIRNIARQFGVAPQSIRAIIERRSWRHIA